MRRDSTPLPRFIPLNFLGMAKVRIFCVAEFGILQTWAKNLSCCFSTNAWKSVAWVIWMILSLEYKKHQSTSSSSSNSASTSTTESAFCPFSCPFSCSFFYAWKPDLTNLCSCEMQTLLIMVISPAVKFQVQDAYASPGTYFGVVSCLIMTFRTVSGIKRAK